VGPYFFVFVVVWIYMRHFINLRIIWSLFTEFKTVGPYGVNWETGQYKGTLAFCITLGLLSSLQALNLIWLFYILRIAYRFVVLNVAEDDRSDGEDEEDEDKEKDEKKKQEKQKALPATNGHAVKGANGAAVANGSAKR
jgi:very-long-chain ceramide synthase